MGQASEKRNYLKIIFDVLKKHQTLLCNIGFSALILALPFAIFYWMLPTFSELTIGNDYQIFSIQQQIELQYALEKGEIPLYAPGFAQGHSASALTLGQLYHPVRLLASWLPSYWEGEALAANTIAKLLGVALVHLLTFFFFIRLSLRRDLSFVVSFIAIYNLRMLDMFRYGASLENYLAYILVCVVLGLFYLHDRKVLGVLSTALTTYLLCVGGHPQIMYLGLLGVGFCYAVMPFAVSAISPAASVDKKRLIQFYSFGAAGLVLGVALAAMYILPFYTEFVKANAIRVGQGYEWSLAYSDSWGGALGSLFRPLNAVVTGAFGGTSLVVVAALFPLTIFVGRRFSIVMGIIWGVTLVIFLMSLGAATPLHQWFWEYFPLANSFRVPGRLSMMMAMPMSLLLAWLLCNPMEAVRILKVPMSVWVGGASVTLLLIFNNEWIDKVPKPTHYIPARIGELPEWVEQRVYELGLVALGLLILHSVLVVIPRFPKGVSVLRGLIGGALMLAIIAQTGICMRYGTWVATTRETPTLEKMEEGKARDVKFFGNAGFGMELPVVSRQMEKSILDPLLARYYRKATPVPSMNEAFKMVTSRTPDEVVIERKNEFEKETQKSTAPQKSPSKSIDNIELTHNTFNTLTFNVEVGASGVMTINYPYQPGWHATVDDESVTVLKANGYQMGIKMAEGTHEVKFVYKSTAAVVGIIISLLVLAGLLCSVVVVFIQRKVVRWSMCAANWVCIVVLFVLWLQSTEGKESLNTQYTWSSSQPLPTLNIAFAKETRASSIHLGQMPYYHYAGRAVDGDRGGRGWHARPRIASPFWQVDLNTSQKVQRLRMIRVSGNVATARRPLHVQTSLDGKIFRTYKLISSRPRTVAAGWEIDLDGVKTRFIRLWAPGSGGFGIAEVEVY